MNGNEIKVIIYCFLAGGLFFSSLINFINRETTIAILGFAGSLLLIYIACIAQMNRKSKWPAND